MSEAERMDRIWFYYAKEQQVGPMNEAELRQAIAGGHVSESDYVYREGFPDWKFLKDVPELQQTRPPLVPPTPPDKRNGAPRAELHEMVVVHNDRFVVTGAIRNISTTGLFLETKDPSYSINDEVKITLKEGKGLGKPVNLKAKIVRLARDLRYPVGYGLELSALDEHKRRLIEEFVRKNNPRQSA